MTNQASYINEDVESLFSDENWKRYFAKAIEKNKKGDISWYGATFNKSLTIVQKLFIYASVSKNLVNLKEQLMEIEKFGYEFSSSDFDPGLIIESSVNSKFANLYIELFEFLESRNIKINKRTHSKLGKVFQYTFNADLIKFLSEKGIDNEFSSIKRLTHRLNEMPIPFMMGMTLIKKSDDGNSLVLNYELENKEKQALQSEVLQKKANKEEYELNFILNYFINKELSKVELKEIIDGIEPDYMRQQGYMTRCYKLPDMPQKMMALSEKVKPREIFNDSQLKVIDLLEKKYKMKIVK